MTELRMKAEYGDYLAYTCAALKTESMSDVPFTNCVNEKKRPRKIITITPPEPKQQIQKVPLIMLALLDRLIAERAEYSYWISRKSTG